MGVLLYELLADKLPYDLWGRSIPEAALAIREEEPSRLGLVHSAFRGDIETIVGKALEKERDRRYASAAELAADIRRHLRDEPVVARPASAIYQLRKFAKRNRAIVSGAAIAVLALTVGLVAAVSWAVKADHSRRAEEDQRALAEQQTLVALRESYRGNVAAAASALREGRLPEARDRLNAAPAALRGWEWHHLYSQTDKTLRTFRTAHPLVTALEVSSDGRTVFMASCNRIGGAKFGLPVTVQAVDMESGVEKDRWEIEGSVRMRLTDDGSQAWVGLGPPRGVRIVNVRTGEAIFETGNVYDLRENPNRYQVLVELSKDLEIVLVDARVLLLRSYDALQWASLEVGFTRFASRGDDHEKLVSFAQRKPPRFGVWNIRTQQEYFLRSVSPGSVTAVMLGAGGRRLYTTGGDGSLRWDATTGQPTAWEVVSAHRGLARGALSPDGRHIATAGKGDGSVRLWDAETGQQLTVFWGASGDILYLTFSPDGSRLVASSTNGLVHVWDTSVRSDPCVLRGHESFVYPVAFSPDGRRIASGGWDGQVFFWDTESGDRIATLDFAAADGMVVHDLAFSPNGSHLRVHRRDRTIITWDSNDWSCDLIDTTTNTNILRHPDSNWSAYDPMGERLLTARVVAGESAGRFGLVLTLQRSDTHEQLAETTIDISLNMCRRTPVFSPDGKRLTAGAEDGLARIWDTETGECVGVLRGHVGEVFGVAYTPDGSRIATGGRDGTVRIWNPETLTELVQLRGHEKYVWSVAFSPDSKRLISGSGDTTVRIWDTEPIRGRIRAKRERRRIVNELEPIVAALFARLGDASAVVAYLHDDISLTDRRREIALQLVLARSVGQMDALASPPSSSEGS